jgi:hypothetical protein
LTGPFSPLFLFFFLFSFFLFPIISILLLYFSSSFSFIFLFLFFFPAARAAFFFSSSPLLFLSFIWKLTAFFISFLAARMAAWAWKDAGDAGEERRHGWAEAASLLRGTGRPGLRAWEDGAEHGSRRFQVCDAGRAERDWEVDAGGILLDAGW